MGWARRPDHEGDYGPQDHGAKAKGQRPQRASPGEAVYGPGLIGALVRYWQEAQGRGERALSVLKAPV